MTWEHPTENWWNIPIAAFSYALQPLELETHHFIHKNNHVIKQAETLSIVESGALFLVKTILFVCVEEPVKFLCDPQYQ